MAEAEFRASRLLRRSRRPRWGIEQRAEIFEIAVAALGRKAIEIGSSL